MMWTRRLNQHDLYVIPCWMKPLQIMLYCQWTSWRQADAVFCETSSSYDIQGGVRAVVRKRKEYQSIDPASSLWPWDNLSLNLDPLLMDIIHYGGQHYLRLIDCGPSRFAIWWHQLQPDSRIGPAIQDCNIFFCPLDLQYLDSRIVCFLLWTWATTPDFLQYVMITMNESFDGFG